MGFSVLQYVISQMRMYDIEDTAFMCVWAPAKQLPDKVNCRESIAITSISDFCYLLIDFLTNTDSEADL